MRKTGVVLVDFMCYLSPYSSHNRMSNESNSQFGNSEKWKEISLQMNDLGLAINVS